MLTSTRNRASLALPIVLGVLLSASSSLAQQRKLDVERFRPALDQHGYLGMQGTRTPGHAKWNVGVFLTWAEELLNVREGSGGSRAEVIERRLTGNLFGQFGIGSRLAVALDVPLVLFQSGAHEPLLDMGPDIPGTALGDPRATLRVRALGEGADVPRDRAEGFGLAFLLAVTLPLGSSQAFAAEEDITTDLQAIGDFSLLGLAAGVMAGWRHRLSKVRLGTVEFRDELEFGLGLKIPIPVTHDFVGVAELRGSTDARSPFVAGAKTAVEAALGVQILRSNTSYSVAVGAGLTDGVGTPQVRGILGVSWAPRVRDADLDGIPDDKDECKHLPEDFDGYQDEDGCLDPDNDNDLVPDDDDKCPGEAADPDRDEDMDGCTDPIRDADGDGVADGDDACPRRAEDVDHHEDGDGCPDPDNDGDGVLDKDDRCPGVAEDRDGHDDADGCPDPDNDGDGVADGDDACPADAEDADGYEDEDGCPDPDNDHDGVVDAEDRCPDAREVINGIDDDDGCKDEGGRALFRVRGEPGTAEWSVSGTVRFGANDAPVARAGPQLDQLVRHLISASPARVRVILGTDRPERAKALADLLEQRGLAPSRVLVEVDSSARPHSVKVLIAPTSSSEAPPE